MPQDSTQWLRGHMREHLARPASADAPVNVVNLAGAPRPRGAAALDLVYKAAEAISDIEERANETEARAKSLVRGAIDKLHAAEARIEAAEIIDARSDIPCTGDGGEVALDDTFGLGQRALGVTGPGSVTSVQDHLMTLTDEQLTCREAKAG